MKTRTTSRASRFTKTAGAFAATAVFAFAQPTKADVYVSETIHGNNPTTYDIHLDISNIGSEDLPAGNGYSGVNHYYVYISPNPVSYFDITATYGQWRTSARIRVVNNQASFHVQRLSPGVFHLIDDNS